MHAGLHIFRHGCRLYALKAFIIIVLAATAGVCIAGQPLRIELPAEPNSTPYQVVPLGQKGVLVFYRIADSSTRTGDTWYFRLFDTGLTEKWQRAPLKQEMVSGTRKHYIEEILCFSLLSTSRTPNIPVSSLSCSTSARRIPVAGYSGCLQNPISCKWSTKAILYMLFHPTRIKPPA